MRWILVVLVALFAVGGISAQEDIGMLGTIYGTTNVRSGPDPRFEIVAQLEIDDRVIIDGRESAASRWLHIRLNDGTSGWIPAFMVIPAGDIALLPVLQMVYESGTSISISAYGRVNVRNAPGIDAEIIGQLDVGDQVPVLARSSDQSDWLMIQFTAEQQGWVAYFTVMVTGDPALLPILVPDSSGEGLIPPSMLIRVLFNARLHSEPALASDLVMIVPFDSEVTPIARSERGDWLYVGYQGAEGWAVARLFAITLEMIMALPVAPLAEATQVP